MENISITMEDVRAHFVGQFPLFMQAHYGEGQDSFQMNNRFISFSGFADFLIREGFKKNDAELIQKIADYINLLFAKGDEWVVNPVYVSFIEGLVDRGYKQPHLKGFIWQMPEEVRAFIKVYFIEEVLIALDLKATDNQEVQ
jgi:hypothetical protein